MTLGNLKNRYTLIDSRKTVVLRSISNHSIRLEKRKARESVSRCPCTSTVMRLECSCPSTAMEAGNGVKLGDSVPPPFLHSRKTG